MRSWIREIFQAGYPLISVERKTSDLILSQRIFRYLQDGDNPDRKFHVPVFLRAGTKQGTVDKTVLLTDQELRIQLPEDFDWVVVNAGATGSTVCDTVPT